MCVRVCVCVRREGGGPSVPHADVRVWPESVRVLPTVVTACAWPTKHGGLGPCVTERPEPVRLFKGCPPATGCQVDRPAARRPWPKCHVQPAMRAPQNDMNEDYVLVRRLHITRHDAVRSLSPFSAVCRLRPHSCPCCSSLALRPPCPAAQRLPCIRPALLLFSCAQLYTAASTLVAIAGGRHCCALERCGSATTRAAPSPCIVQHTCPPTKARSSPALSAIQARARLAVPAVLWHGNPSGWTGVTVQPPKRRATSAAPLSAEPLSVESYFKCQATERRAIKC